MARKSLLYIGVPPNPGDGTSRSHARVPLNTGLILRADSVEVRVSNLDPVQRTIDTFNLQVYQLAPNQSRGTFIRDLGTTGSCPILSRNADGTPSQATALFQIPAGV